MDYSTIQQTASWVLTTQGEPVTLTLPGSGTYDPTTATFSGTPTQVQTFGTLLPLDRGLTHIPGTDIQSGDQQLLLAGAIAQPPVGSTVQVAGRPYTIMEVNPVAPGGLALYYDCIVRGSQ